MATYIYAFTEPLLPTGTVTRMKELTINFDCIDPLTEDCDVCLNNQALVLPYFENDVFCYTLSFTPIDVEVLDINGVVIGSFPSWINGNQLCIDTADVEAFDPTLLCWYVRVQNASLEYSCFERGYTKFDTTYSDNVFCGMPSIRIESSYDELDCANNDYTLGYTNGLNFYADFDKVRSEEDATVVNNKRTRTDIYDIYEVRILQPLPPDSQTLSQLSTITLRGFNLTVTDDSGTQHVFQDFTGTVSRVYEFSHDWYPTFELRKLVCSIDSLCTA